jgi:Mrp family chromosome partitioning ATPase
MDQLIRELRGAFDLVIFDMPPIVQVTDAQIMASKVDGTILVVREDVSSKDAVVKAQKLLQMVNANILGAIYHGTKNAVDQGYYYYGS